MPLSRTVMLCAPGYRHGEARFYARWNCIIWPVSSIVVNIHCLNVSHRRSHCYRSCRPVKLERETFCAVSAVLLSVTLNAGRRLLPRLRLGLYARESSVRHRQFSMVAVLFFLRSPTVQPVNVFHPLFQRNRYLLAPGYRSRVEARYGPLEL